MKQPSKGGCLFGSPLFLLFTLFAALTHGQSVPLPYSKGALADFPWNGTTPLSLPREEGLRLKFFLIQNDKETELAPSSFKDPETDLEELRLLPASAPDYNSEAFLKITDGSKLWPFQHIKAKITWNTNLPLLRLVSASPQITRGGSALAVVQSETKDQLLRLAFYDENNTPYYPQTFKKDGYYALIFPWYMAHGPRWARARITAMDRAGNSTSLILDISSKGRTFVEKRIMLGADYGTEKAKELGLSPEEAKKLETNIVAINAALAAATTRTFDRWKETRLPFEASIARTIESPSELFAKTAPPLKNNFRITATFGDRRRYFFREQQVRESTHAGQDMANTPNMPVYSILDGQVVYADWNGGNGKTIVIRHGLDIYSFYAHNSAFKVKEGDRVKAGQQISISGTTGQSTGDHLHLSLIVQGMYIQPEEWMDAAFIRRQFVAPLMAAEKLIAAEPTQKISPGKALPGAEKPPPEPAPIKETWVITEK